MLFLSGNRRLERQCLLIHWLTTTSFGFSFANPPYGCISPPRVPARQAFPVPPPFRPPKRQFCPLRRRCASGGRSVERFCPESAGTAPSGSASRFLRPERLWPRPCRITGASFKNARAMEIRWRSPPDRVAAVFPDPECSSPSGSWSANSSHVGKLGCCQSLRSSVASFLPIRMFSKMVLSNSVTS